MKRSGAKKPLLKNTFSLALVLGILLCAALFLSTAAAEASTTGYLDPLHYYVEDNGEITITGIDDYISTGVYVENVVIPSSIDGHPVTAIADRAFENMGAEGTPELKIKSIVIPGSVKTIGRYAFNDLYTLESVTIGDGVKSIGNDAFWDCSSLKSVSLPDSVTEIESGAFLGCTSLQSVRLPKGLKDLGSVFCDCTSLTTITLPAGLETINGTFWGCTSLKSIVIPDSVTEIGAYTFAECTSLTDISLGSGLKIIKNYAFYSCTFLEEITLPSSLERIGSEADSNAHTFSNCTSLANVIIPDGLKTIANYAFSGCSSLKEITLPSSVSRIGEYSFGTDNLERAYVHYSSYAGKYFRNAYEGEVEIIYGGTTAEGNLTYISENNCLIITGCTETIIDLVIPEEIDGLPVIAINGGAFANHTALKNVYLPDSIVELGDSAFSGCTNLSGISLPGGLTSIGKNCFANTALTEITLYDNISYIGEYAFGGCALETVHASEGSYAAGHFSEYYVGIPQSHIHSYLDYEIVDNEAVITGYHNNPVDLVIPSEINSYPVTGIAYEAFYACKTLQSVEIPASVTEFEGRCFVYCDNLSTLYTTYGSKAADYVDYFHTETAISFLDEVTPEQIFYYDIQYNRATITGMRYRMAEVVIPQTLDGAPVAYLSDAFYNARYLKKITLPEGLITVGTNCFYGCTNLSEINLPSSLSTIGNRAFQDCDSLKEIIIPDRVSNLSNYAFYGCDQLENVVLGSGCTDLSDNLFWQCTSLKNVVIPEGVKTMGSATFGGTAIETAEIPFSVESIAWNSFINSSLSTVYVYEGSYAEEFFAGENVDVEYITTDISKLRYTESNGEITITGCTDYSLPIVSIPQAIDGKPVTALAAYAFSGNYEIETLILPGTIKTIGAYVCGSYSDLTTVCAFDDGPAKAYFTANYPDVDFISKSYYEYEVANGEATITGYKHQPVQLFVPSELGGYPVTAIGYDAFYDCDTLESLVLPDSIKTLESWCFSNCSNLKSVKLPAALETMESDCFSQTALTEVVLPNTLTSMSNGNFSRCYSLESVTLSTGLTKLDEGIFWETYALKSIVIPDSITEIIENCFYRSGLEEVTIPDSVTSIKRSSFSSCSSLKTLHTPYGSYAADFFSSNYPAVTINYLGEVPPEAFVTYSIADGEVTITGPKGSPAELVIPDTIEGLPVTTIEYNAFNNRDFLKKITIPASVKNIEWGAFCGCDALEEVILSEGLEFIGGDAFYGCSSLTSIAIPDSVTELASSIFNNCQKLENVTLGTGAEHLSWNMFANCTSLKSIVIPEGVLSLDEGTFGNSGLETITLPRSLEYIIDIDPFNTESLATVYLFKGSYAEEYFSEEYDGEIEIIYIVTAAEDLEYTEVNGEITITGGSEDLAELFVPEEIDDMPVTAIAANAFAGHTGLELVNIPESVSSIGENAFSGCSALTDIELPESITSLSSGIFAGVAMEYYEVPASIKSIGDNAFAGSALENIEIPATVTSIGSGAFGSCEQLSIVYTPKNSVAWNYFSANHAGIELRDNSYVPKNLKYQIDGNDAIITGYTGNPVNVVIPEIIRGRDVTIIDYDAFWDCSSLASVTVPDSVRIIRGGAFDECRNLASITLPDTIEELRCCFYGCTKLKSFVVPSNPELTSLSDYMLEGCTSLESVIIHSNITSFGEDAFYNCQKLATLYTEAESFAAEWFSENMPDVEIIYLSESNSAFIYSEENGKAYIEGLAEGVEVSNLFIPGKLDGLPVAGIADSAFEGNNDLELVYINASALTHIGDKAFKDCSGITRVVLPVSIAHIGNEAFSGCGALSDIKLPSNLESIGSAAFKNCVSLENLTLPAIESVAADTFAGCSGITWVDVPGSVNTIGSGAFSSLTSLEDVYVPEGSVAEAYFAENHPDVDIHAYGAAPKGLKFEINGNEITFTGWDHHNRHVVIPDELMGRPVTVIGRDAFAEDYNLLSVTIPDSVEIIESNAFTYCESLAKVSFGKGLKVIGNYAFCCCSMSELDLPNGLETIGRGAFESCSNLTHVEIPDSVASMGAYAFYCACQESILIPESVTEIDNIFGDEEAYTTLYTTPGSAADIYCSENYPLVTIIYLTHGESDITYTIENGEATITGAINDPSVLRLPAAIEGVPVTRIAASAFKDVSSLESIILPKHLKEIGDTAFSGCSALSSIKWNAAIQSIGKEAFAGAALENLNLPAGLASLGDGAFKNCTSLCEISLPTGVTELGDSVFSGCSNLDAILTLPSHITSIGSKCFADSGITELRVNDTLTSIADDAFSGCELDVVFAPENSYAAEHFASTHPEIEIICAPYYFMYEINEDDEAVIIAGMNNPVNLVIPAYLDGYPVTTIGCDAFYGIDSLETLVLPDTVKKLEGWCFSDCSNLKSVQLPKYLEEMEDDCFSRTALTEIVLPDTLTGMLNGNFSRCYNLASVILPKNLTWLDEGIFWENISLKSIVIPDSVTEIYENCFIYSGLEEITIPASVTKMDVSTFEGCDQLTTLYTSAGSYAESFFRKHYPDVKIDTGEEELPELEAFSIALADNQQIAKGTPIQIELSFLPEELAEAVSVEWNVSNENIAAIDENGVLTFSHAGYVSVSATANMEGDVNDSLLVYCPAESTLTLPAMLASIEDEAFAGSAMEEIILPNGVTSIGSRAFADCEYLCRIVIPDSVIDFADDAFDGCDRLAICAPEGSKAAVFAKANGILLVQE